MDENAKPQSAETACKSQRVEGKANQGDKGVDGQDQRLLSTRSAAGIAPSDDDKSCKERGEAATGR